MTLLLDTHVLIWWVEDEAKLSAKQRRLLARCGPESPALVSDTSLWEIALLQEARRIRIRLPLREWLERAVAPPLVRLQSVTPAIAAEVAMLPSSFHRDPADRILVATARVLGATLLTLDGRIVTANLVPTLS